MNSLQAKRTFTYTWAIPGKYFLRLRCSTKKSNKGLRGNFPSALRVFSKSSGSLTCTVMLGLNIKSSLYMGPRSWNKRSVILYILVNPSVFVQRSYMNFQPLGSGISWKDRTPSKVPGLSISFAFVLCDLHKFVKGMRYCFLTCGFLRKAILWGNILLTLSEMSLVYGLGVCLLRSIKSTGSGGVQFVVRTSKPVKILWKKCSVISLIALQFRYTFCIP